MMQTLKSTMIMVVESLINKFEDDQMRKEEMVQEKQQSNSQYTDNCSDSDSSFNQVKDKVHTLWWQYKRSYFIHLFTSQRVSHAFNLLMVWFTIDIHLAWWWWFVMVFVSSLFSFPELCIHQTRTAAGLGWKAWLQQTQGGRKTHFGLSAHSPLKQLSV